MSNDSFYCIVGKIMNTAAEVRILDENVKVDPAKADIIAFDQFLHDYYARVSASMSKSSDWSTFDQFLHDYYARDEQAGKRRRTRARLHDHRKLRVSSGEQAGNA